MLRFFGPLGRLVFSGLFQVHDTAAFDFAANAIGVISSYRRPQHSNISIGKCLDMFQLLVHTPFTIEIEKLKAHYLHSKIRGTCLMRPSKPNHGFFFAFRGNCEPIDLEKYVPPSVKPRGYEYYCQILLHLRELLTDTPITVYISDSWNKLPSYGKNVFVIQHGFFPRVREYVH